jgi:hypothetical protein
VGLLAGVAILGVGRGACVKAGSGAAPTDGVAERTTPGSWRFGGVAMGIGALVGMLIGTLVGGVGTDGTVVVGAGTEAPAFSAGATVAVAFAPAAVELLAPA